MMSQTFSPIRMTARETRRSATPWFLLPIALVGWWYALARMPADAATWLHTSVAIGLAGTVMIPLVGGIAAWVAGRERRRGMSDLLASTPCPAVLRDLATWSAVVLWSLLGYVALGVVFVMTSDVLGDWGGPVVWPIVIGALTIAAGAALGYMLGALVPSRFTPALVPIGMAFPLGAPHTWGLGWPALKRLSPEAALWPYDYDVFFGLPEGRTWPLALWLCGLIALAFAVVVASRSGFRSPIALVCITVATAMTVVGASAVLSTPDSLRGASNVREYEPVCRTGVVEVCVHPAFEDELNSVSEPFQRLFAPIAGISGVPTRVEQLPPTESPIPDNTIRIQLIGDPELEVVNTVTALLTDNGAVRESPPDDAAVMRLGIGRWLIDKAGGFMEILSGYAFTSSPAQAERILIDADRIRERFDALPEAEQRAWLEANFADLRLGRVTPDDLP